MLTEPAPAKINLALHVIGRLDDGRHALESPVAFAELADTVAVEPADRDAFRIDGPFAPALADDDPAANLVLRARDALRARAGVSAPVAIALTKRVPVAAGLGGGSADAAATLRALRSLWRLALTDADLAAVGAPLGSDVPMCVVSRALVAKGAGERLAPLEGGAAALGLAGRGLVLLNPGAPVSTAAVFAALERRGNAPLPPVGDDPLEWLRSCRNDLEAPARAIAPAIGEALDVLRGGALLARMSGSGATCFAVVESEAAAEAMRARIAARHPDWFVAATRFADRPANGDDAPALGPVPSPARER